MQGLFAIVTSWPTAIYTVLLGVVVLYWVLALVGLVDFEHGGLDLDGHHDIGVHADGDHLSTIASYVVAFGLHGVPFSVVISLLTLIAWVCAGLLAQYLLPWVPTQTLRALAGLGMLVFAMVPAIVLTAWVVKPMRGLFVQHAARSNRSLVGLYCRVTTLNVSERFGQAEASDGNGSFNIRVRAEEPNALTKGSRALIIDYDESSQRYRVEAADENA
ncbi:MAG: hypothetical protein L6Q60_02560 [Rhodocyclaceae bacterium]|nr:hypothetical protein [Rhodocyclaceae bacterium]